MMNQQRNNINIEQTRLAKRDEVVANDDKQARDVSVQQGTNESGSTSQQEAN